MVSTGKRSALTAEEQSQNVQDWWNRNQQLQGAHGNVSDEMNCKIEISRTVFAENGKTFHDIT